MTQKQAIQLFEQHKVRTLWNDEAETWYFSILDVIAVLTDSVNPTDYFKKMRKRDELLSSFVGTNCPQEAMKTETGVMRKTLVGDMKCVLRVIQSIPSPKAEPFKQWMAQVAQRGGSVAKEARKHPENQLGRSVISPINAKQVLGTHPDNAVPETAYLPPPDKSTKPITGDDTDE